MGTCRLTVVMYHYVRPIAKSSHPGIRGLELEAFEGQLDYLQKYYRVVSAAQVVAASCGRANLPAAPVLLTFDDGYKDHFRYVYPALKRRRLSGTFFPPAGVVRERRILDVNKVHFILANVANPEVLVAEIEEAVAMARDEFELLATEEYRRRYWQANRFDPPEVIYVKRMLQVGLPAALRARLAAGLFSRHVSEDESGFAEDLYVSEHELKEMLDGGMEIGSHGYSHNWLNSLGILEQSDDIDRSLALLADLGVAREGFFFCYPYGAYTAETMELLKRRGCGCAMTTKVGLADIDPKGVLEMARIDTNDLPHTGQASPVGWTLQALSPAC